MAEGIKPVELASQNRVEHGCRPLLEIRALTKTYDAVTALRAVSLSLPAGCILGVIGENGAGKSTFAKCVTGLVRPTGGEILLDGRPVRGMTPAISGIPQEFDLVEHLSVAENIFLGREPGRWLLLDRRKMNEASSRQLAKLRAEVSPEALIAALSPSQKQMVAIAKAFAGNCRVLVMDEPTTILNPEETARLFAVMREFRAAGNAIVYISHKLAEVREICDRIAVFRDGELISVDAAAELEPAEMARRMVGRELTRLFPEPLNRAPGEMVLEVENLVAAPQVKGVSFGLRRGELLGVAGLAGAGRTELAEALAGLRRIDGGGIKIAGHPVRFRSAAQAVAAGVSYLSEDRQGSGILPDFSIEENITLVSLAKYCRCGFYSRRRGAAGARNYVKRFRIKPSDVAMPLRALSGGNQQKVAVARGLDTAPSVFIFDEPTRGVDVGARREIYDFIRDLAAGGVGCLLISSDMEELLGMCRKIMVMREGKVAGFVSGERLTEAELMYLAIGVKHEVE